MAVTNHERVGKALEMLTAGLRPFVERELKSTCQQGWFEETRRALGIPLGHLRIRCRSLSKRTVL
ncbi:MAG: Swt1 family HEPN domain-containing protein [Limisphaerales bacterium]